MTNRKIRIRKDIASHIVEMRRISDLGEKKSYCTVTVWRKLVAGGGARGPVASTVSTQYTY